MVIIELPFEKKELIVKVSNPNNLPTVDYHKLSILQGDLKVLSEKNKGKLCKSILKHGYFVPAFVWRSGTTLIAADQLNRVCYGIEIAPGYVDVILERYYKLTGIDPVRQDGKKWSELKSI